MTRYIKTSVLASALSLSRKQTLERARSEGWPCVKRKGTLVFLENRLPEGIRLALTKTEIQEAEQDGGQSGLSQLTDKAREVANNRNSLLYEYHQSGLKAADFVDAYNTGQIRKYLLGTLGQISVRTLYRWDREHKAADASGTVVLAALAPRYGIKKSGAGVTLSETERALLKNFYLHSSRPAMAHAWKNMLRAFPQSRCTYQTASRFLQSIPPAERDYYRLGKKRFEDLYLPYVEQNIDRYKPLDMVVSDHHVMDCVVLYHGKLVRPWITTFQDYRSGKVLGYFATVKPSSLSIIVAYYMCCIRYGVPKAVLFDNGKDYRSKLINGYKTTAKQFLPDGMTEEVEIFFQGILPALGSEVHFTRTYSGKSKGRQERYYRILEEYLSKDIGSYIGSDSTTRPADADLMWRSINGMAKREDIPTWEFFVQASSAMIEHINDTFTSQGKGMDGKTRSRVFAEQMPERVRRVSKEELQQALYKSEVHHCGRNGIKHHKVNYYHPALMQYAGQDVIIRNKLVTDDELPVYALDGSYVCTAIANYFVEGDDFKEAIKRVASVKKQSFLLLAERGTNEVAIEAERRLAIETTINAFDDSGFSIEELFGEDEAEALPLAAGAEPLAPRPVKQTKYISELDAGAERILGMEAKQ